MIADKKPLAAAASAGGLVPAATLARIAAAAPEADRTGSFPWEGLRALHEAGLLEATVSTENGGHGADLATAARILAEIGRADPSVALIASMNLFNHLTQAQRSTWPTDVYRALLEQARRQPVLINAARGEPDLGSPSRGGLPSTIARRMADGWRISGRKRFVTGSEGLTHFLVWAATDEPEQRVGTFIVTTDTPGIEIVRNWDSLGMRATSSHDVVFRDVAVAADHVINIGPAGRAEQDNRAHAAMTLGLTAIYLGVAEAAQDVFAEFARTRIPANLGRPIATTDRIITAAGEIALLTGSARDIIFDALDHHQDSPETLMRARLIAGRNIQEAVQIAVRTLGNPALSADLGLERHFRNVQATLVHAPQEDVAISILGRAALA
ncbi:acyl-CoA dehydrogenase family protein [Falsirhodobacter xinxiangensis]|uniref:acyl-CoA dehydrogenase family protein n=1 Tax=Falsirhodobacter xinxiangensis TaxID=2530049 RepID=UPI0010AB3326|nr:acyl-CoA dehydrogenase family protein [Rhodobacter xinxiangensis]